MALKGDEWEGREESARCFDEPASSTWVTRGRDSPWLLHPLRSTRRRCERTCVQEVSKRHCSALNSVLLTREADLCLQAAARSPSAPHQALFLCTRHLNSDSFLFLTLNTRVLTSDQIRLHPLYCVSLSGCLTSVRAHDGWWIQGKEHSWS